MTGAADPAGPPTISATDVRKSYGDLVAVDGVSFAVEAGEYAVGLPGMTAPTFCALDRHRRAQP
jgi:hypothetical protein